jgi:hypothetical protein
MQTVTSGLWAGILATSTLLGEPGAPDDHNVAAEAKEAPPPARRFFKRPIDYWQRGLTYAEEKSAAPKGSADEGARPLRKAAPSEWGQVLRQPDGSLAYYELPRALVLVLEDPSPENIEGYLDWKMGRVRKILRAAQAIKEYRSPPSGAPQQTAGPEKKAGPPEKAPGTLELPEAPPSNDVPKSPFTVTYFHRSGCPHCDSQDVVLSRWLKGRPEGKLVVVNFGEKPDLWRRFQVRGTPTLVIEAKGSPKPVVVEGLSQEAELDRALGESVLAKSLGPAAGRKE